MLFTHKAGHRGVILLVVIVMLTLFAILGIAFVYYAQAEADASSIFRDSASVQVGAKADAPSAQLLDEFLRQLIYDVPDDSTGVNSALRGHSLARTMYGWNDLDPTHNDKAYNGVGRVHTKDTSPAAYTFCNGYGKDDYLLPNYMWFATLEGPAPGSGFSMFLRDPEHMPPNYTTAVPQNMRNGSGAPSQARGAFIGANVSYTYPDLNNLFLAAVAPDGTVKLPSYFRDTTALSASLVPPDTTPFGPLDPANPNWTSAGGDMKYRVLRPRPADNPAVGAFTAFALPADKGGDVKNLTGGNGYATGNNDSIWLDLGSPVRTLPDGTQYKALFAALIMDLDNRLNVNVHGNVANMRGGAPTTPATQTNAAHFSNQGWGPWEVSLAKVLSGSTPPSPPNEWTNLFVGNAGGNLLGRYGSGNSARPTYAGTALWQNTPGQVPQAPPLPTLSHFYSQVDFDGLDVSGAAPVASVQMQTPPVNQPPWPVYGSNPGGYDNYTSTTPNGEQIDHPALFNIFVPNYASGTPTTTDHGVFDVSNTRAMIHDLSTPTELGNSTIGQLLQSTFQTQTNSRMRLTTHSFDVDQPGITPWLYDPTQISNYKQQATASSPPAVAALGPELPPSAPASGNSFPGLDKRVTTLTDQGEFGGLDWRAIGAALGKIDLNRTLPPYPAYNPTGFTPAVNYYDRYDDNSKLPVVQAFLNAQAARQQFAQDIYTRLLYVTIGRTTNPAYGDSGFDASQAGNMATLRWLAQLAVNIVDYIDEDDVSTPFNFYNDGNSDHSQWVFGTEMPHLLINEVLAEKSTDNTGKIEHRVFAELHNPFVTTGAPNGQSLDTQPVILTESGIGTSANTDTVDDVAGLLNQSYSTYQILVSTGPASTFTTGLTKNDNVWGFPDPSTVRAQTKIQFKPRTTPPPPTYWPYPTAPAAPGDSFGSALTMSPDPANVLGMAYSPPFGPPPQKPFVMPQSWMLVGPQTTAITSVGTPPNYNGPNTYDRVILSPAVPAPTLWCQSDDMRYTPTSGSDAQVTVSLMRLANPHIPFDPNPTVNGVANGPTNPWFNPYITVDYMENVKVWDRGGADPSSQSTGKKQPYVASQTSGQDPTPVPNGTTSHSFGKANSPLTSPFSWLVHLDRNLVSPAELLQVSGFQPWQLTHQFLNTNVPLGHLVPWFDEDLASPVYNPVLSASTSSHRLYRLFEFLSTHSLACGVAGTGRTPGKVNLNTNFDPAPATSPQYVFSAVCDQNAANNFVQSDVDTAWQNLVTAKIPSGIGLADERPFYGMAAGQSPAAGGIQYPAPTTYTDPNGLSVNNTLLCSNNHGSYDGANRSLQAASLATGSIPYFQDQMLAKIFNQVTTRSHVFAVYLTVGFFRVTPNIDGSGNPWQPVTLGEELNLSTGTNIRHHMFAIVDRSALTQLRIPQQWQAANLPTAGSNNQTTSAINAPLVAGQPSAQTVTVNALSGTQTATNLPWNIQVGSPVLVDPANSSQQEVVTVTAVNPLANSFTANFTKMHASNVYVYVPVETQQTSGTVAAPSPGIITITPSALQDSNSPPAWSIQPGTQLFLDVAPNQEAVTVSSVDTSAGTFTASSTRTHTGTVPIFVPLASATAQTGVGGSGSYSITVNSGNYTTAGSSFSGSLSPSSTNVTVPNPSGQAGAPAWTIQPGSIITVDSAASQETVEVTSVSASSSPPTFTATFNKPHAAGFGIYVPKFGNPGPQANFSAPDNSAVVLYAAVID